MCLFFFFKQKTAYEMRISDWSSDVCSSDLEDRHRMLSAGLQSRGGEAAGHQLPPDALITADPQVEAGEVEGPAGAEVTDLAVEIGRASCRERVCQYV